MPMDEKGEEMHMRLGFPLASTFWPRYLSMQVETLERELQVKSAQAEEADWWEG